MKKFNSIFLLTGLIIFLSRNATGQAVYSSTSTSNTVANTRLSNLVSSTSINQDLLPKLTNYYNLGSSIKSWKGIYVGTINANGLSTLNGLKLNGFGTGFLKTNSSGQVGSALLTASDIPALPYLKLTGGSLTGLLNGTSAIFSGNVNAASFIKTGGTSNQILAANGSVITAGSGITISGGIISSTGGGGGSISSLNGLTGSTQSFATGTNGTDFTITSSGTTHTFNIPSASSTKRGLLTSADWATFNGKQSTITLTTTGNSGPATFSGNILNIPNYAVSGSAGWALSGNSGTTDGTNFIGTIDNVPLSFRVNNNLSGRIESDFNTANTFYGYKAGVVNTGKNNTAYGYAALISNTTGISNTAIGAVTLFNNTTGSYNTANGNQALLDNTTGSGNTASGFQALLNNTGGSGNTANGYQALLNNAGDYNIANGYQALYFNSIGFENTANGVAALYSNTTGSFNTANGAFGALYSNTTGNVNTAIGYRSLYSNITGSFLTTVGEAADVNADGYINSTAIGSGALIDGSNVIILGNSSITAIKANVTSITSLSDGRFKKNIKENVPGLEFINLLKPVTYNYDIKAFSRHRNPATTATKESKDLRSLKQEEIAITDKERILYSGLVAQDVEAAANKIGYNFSGLYKPQNDKDAYGLGYADFVVPLIKATQELSAFNDSLRSEVADLQKQLNEIKVQLASITKGSVSSGSVILSNARLEQNIPNPFNQTTQIRYSIPQTAASAVIVVTGVNGEKIKTVSVNTKGDGQLTLQTSQLGAGTYTYSLYVDGNLIDAKKMILAK